MLVYFATSFFCSLICLWILRIWKMRIRNTSLYPPGPEGLPLIGNIFDMPSRDEWETARHWGKEYGPLVFIKLFGSPFLFLNSYQSIVDLLEKRGSIYSSRPKHVMLELGGWTSWVLALLPYGEELKSSRQLLYQYFQQESISDNFKIQESSVYMLLDGLLKTPNDFAAQVRNYSGRVVLRMTYGYNAVGKNDPYIELSEQAMNVARKTNGFYLVNILPWLRFLPSWFPGTEFQEVAKEGRKIGKVMRDKPFEMTKGNTIKGIAFPSLVSNFIDQQRNEDELAPDEEFIKNIAAVVYGAGVETTTSAITTFILAMVLYPKVLKRGQEEIDRVVGQDTLPIFNDRPNLPYIEAICKECMRWQPVTPLAIAHTVTEDDMYGDFLIPKGTTILPNAWAVLRDPEIYMDPDEFKPERWLSTEGEEALLDPSKLAFGFGRRICPGRYLADNLIFLSVACILATFDIDKLVGDDGVPIIPTPDYDSYFVRKPEPFKCSITPRSDKAISMIQHALDSEFQATNFDSCE